MKWPLKYRFWKRINHITATFAWRYADPGGEDWGKALRINHNHPLWRLNKWAGNRWIPWWIKNHRKLK